MSSERVFQILLFLGLVAGGWLYGDYWKKTDQAGTVPDNAPKLRAENAELTQTIDRLQDEIAQLRSLLTDGPYPVPDELIRWVEKEHNMVFLKTPNVRLAPYREIHEAALENLNFIHGESDLEYEDQAWKLLGFLPPDDHLLSQLILAQSSGLKGIFNQSNGQILLSDNFDSVSIPDRSVMVRLLGQQLSFQNHPRKEWSSRDEWQAWLATHVGAAADLQARFLKRNTPQESSGWKDPEPRREEILNTLAPALQGFLNFPYLEGTNFAHERFLESRQAWAQMFVSPPETTQAVIHPGQEPLSTPKALIPKTATGKTIFEDSLGELGLRLWLEPSLGNDLADQFAPHWIADRYRLTETEGSQALVWWIRLSDSDVAAQLASEISRSLIPDLRQSQAKRKIFLSQEDDLLMISNLPKTDD